MSVKVEKQIPLEQNEEKQMQENNLTDEEIIRRLRLRGDVVTYFGETPEERRERLMNLDKYSEVDYSELEKKLETSFQNRMKEGLYFFGQPDILAQRKREEEEEEQRGQEEFHKMTPQQQRLFKLRLRLNESRKKNIEEMIKEDRELQLHNKPKQFFYKHKKRIREEEAKFEITAEQAEKIQEKRRKKEENRKNNDFISADAAYRAYEKRTQKVPYTLEDYNKLKEKLGDELYVAQTLNYGKDVITDDKGVRNMVKELREQEEKRKTFSRRREFFEEEDVTYINERNRKYNKKLSKAFDKYTAEIKQNLERGSAV